MNRNEKAELVGEIGTKLKSAKVALLAKYQGLTVAQTNQFRRELRQASGECQVAKNTLARRALDGTSFAPAERWLEGQTALVFGYDDPIAVAKIVARWAETESEKFWIKGGIFEGEVLEPKSVVALSKTPSKDVLRAQLLACLQAPAAKLVRLLVEPGAQLARLLAAREKSLGGGGDNG
ncbi:MAG: 50S ribosomal protein L10 [Candidatus Binatia bacterium]